MDHLSNFDHSIDTKSDLATFMNICTVVIELDIW